MNNTMDANEYYSYQAGDVPEELTQFNDNMNRINERLIDLKKRNNAPLMDQLGINKATAELEEMIGDESWCCGAPVSESHFCTQCWDHA